VPVYELLGGLAQERITAYASGGLDADHGATRDELQRYRERGFRAVKIRIWEDAAHDEAKMRLVRDVLGDDAELMVDAMMGHNPAPWSAKEALRRARVMEELGVTWFEEPCANTDYAGYRFVREHTRVPVAGGESAIGTAEFARFFDHDALDIAQPDPTHTGGIIETRRVAAMARSRGVRIVYHSWGAAPCLWANYHMAFADPACPYLELPTHGLPLIDALTAVPFELRDGCIEAPAAPGLGARLPREVIDRYPFEPNSAFWT
jgi:L-alanine-DL-glutamate epimerase-like enolase superfamily enzyme